jgi:hypothetical protein
MVLENLLKEIEMSKKIVKIILVSFLLSTISCGGGSSGGDPFFGGVYNVSLIKVEDSCNALPQTTTSNQVHTVNQDGRRIVLDSGQVVLQGQVIDDNTGFDVVNRRESDGCVTSTAVVYRPTDQDADYGVGFAIIARCGGESECIATFGGLARKR